ncbi:MAG: ATP-binding protein [Prevotella sp.]|nr:ATP-binding protein [Prevotella sp.]
MEENKYELDIDVRILELLGPNLYTNIYYVLAELIANAYDADAHNVYIISDDKKIIVEDDGKGMSYSKGEIAKYLKVAAISRSNEKNSRTALNRLKMGRKGVGKLAALSVSEEVHVMTIANGEQSGFVLSRHPQSKKLQSIPNDKIRFEKISKNGTAIIMLNPQYHLHKTSTAIKRNLLKIFPAINEDFKIHILMGGKEEIMDSVDREIGYQLCACIILGNKSLNIKNTFRNEYPNIELLVQKQPQKFPLMLKNNQGEEKEYNLIIEGWIGAYKTTRGRKLEASDFPDNFISLYAHEKMGEFNVLPSVGGNKLNESFVVGQLYIDLFELSELPDMALSNRQGYKSDDPRYLKVIDFIKEDLLPSILSKRVAYAKAKKDQREKERISKQEGEEKAFRQNVRLFRESTSSQVARIITNQGETFSKETVRNTVENIINKNSKLLGLKPHIDQQKKKLFISHTGKDKEIGDIVYNMLIFNHVPQEDIIYTSCDDEISRIPQGMNIYEYLRKFFVDSVSDKKMYVLFITSDNTKTAWGAMVEIGASWITRVDHKIFNINNFRPEHPLNDEIMWNTINRRAEDGRLSMTRLNCDDFCSKIEQVCNAIGYPHRTRDENKVKLSSLIIVE